VERRLDAVTAIEARHREGAKLRRWVKAHRTHPVRTAAMRMQRRAA
jgi:hypothetical protein